MGLAIKNHLLPNLTETPTGISERLMSIRIPLARKQYATVFSAYAPTLPSEEGIKDRFYEMLDEALHKVPKNDKILLMGDFNARVGRDSGIWKGVLGQHGIGHSNANGIRLLSLCAEHSLNITNTTFQLKNKYKTSWMHPRSKHWHLLDYVIVRQSDLRDVQITRAMRGAECWTDHRLIMTVLRMRIRPAVHLQKSTKKRLHCALLQGTEARNTFRRSLANQLENIESLLGRDDTTEEKWSSLSASLYEAAAQSIGYSRKKHQDWFDENSTYISTLLSNMHIAHKASLNNPSSAALKHNWQAHRREVQCALRLLQNKWWVSKAQEIQSYADRYDMHNFYDAIKSTHGPRTHTVCPLRTADESSLIKDQALIVQRWGEHFEALLNQQAPTDFSVLEELPTLPTIQSLDIPPSFSEVHAAIRALKNNKSPGPDSIPAEILKQGGYLCTRAIHQFISLVWREESIPQQWKDANIVTIFKNKGDKSICGNSRGIALLSVAGKVLAKIMLHRLINNITEALLPESQCGFRRNRSTVDMIFTSRQLQEKCREQKQDLFMAFVDLSKAFDSVHRDLLWRVLLHYGCPVKFVNILRQFHDGMMAKVTIGGLESAPFKVATGVRQGCTLAPVLFNIFLLCVTTLLHKEMEEGSGVSLEYRLDGNLFNIRRLQAKTKLQSVHILELQYADDCALVAHTPEALQATITAAEKAYSRMGLSVNISKTEVLCQWSSEPPQRPPTFTIAGSPLTIVPHFKYLGSILSDDCSIDQDIQHRIKQASSSFGRMRNRVFNNNNLHLHTKVSVYKAICITTLLYGCEAWTIYARHLKMLEAFHIRCLQRILQVTWQDRVPHSVVLQRTSCRSIEAIIMHHQLRWLGHVTRMPASRLPRKTLYGQLHLGRRSAGGQKKRLKDQLKTFLKKCKIQPAAMEAAAADRSSWRGLCHQGAEAAEENRRKHHLAKRERRKAAMSAPVPSGQVYSCPVCGRQCASRIGLYSHQRTHKQ